MNGKPPPSLLKPVLIAGAISLVVTAVRLYGEVQGWKTPLLKVAGITWLIFVFGFWFGARLARAGQGPASPGKVAVLHAIAVVVMIGAFFATFAMLDKTADGKPDIKSVAELEKFMYTNVACGGVAALIALYAWPRLWLTNLLYAIVARVPVVIVTYVACKKNWQTHYEMLGPSNLGADWETKAYWLSFGQLTMWPEMTVVFGGLCGALAALILGRKKAPPPA